MFSFARDRSHDETQVDLVGGLGNQLFGYIAGKYLEEVKGHNVIFNTWHIPRGLTSHAVSVEGRNLEGEFRSIPPAPKWKKPFHKSFGSKDPGWEPKFASVRQGARVEGYFQTWKYMDALDEAPLSRNRLIPQSGPSAWLQENIDFAISAGPFVLHFRRGDYKNVLGGAVLLGRDYYVKALGEIRKRFDNPDIWIFSDEPQLARRFFRDLGDDFRIIDPPSETDAGESMVLMAFGHGHIISNSTFAWWGAHLSPTCQIVIAPSPWMPGRDAPQDLFPKNWVLLDHNWGAA